MKLSQKLSVSLGIRSLILLISLGLLMAFLQTFFDFKDRLTEVRQSIDAIVTSAKGSASNAVYLLEPRMAQQVIDGLAYFDYFSYVAIVDDHGNVMADFSRQQTQNNNVAINTSFNPVLSLFIDNFSRDVIPLHGEGLAPNRDLAYGEMIIVRDMHVALSGVYERAVRAFLIALMGYIFLTIALGYLYHVSLASPLIRLSRRFQQVNTKSIATQKISHLIGHEKNEFSLIVNSANDMLSRISYGQVLLTERSQRFRLILDTAPALIFSLDNSLKFVFANKAAASFYGYSIYELKSKTAAEIIAPVDMNMLKSIETFINSNKRHFADVLLVRNANRHDCHLELSLVKFKTPDGQSILVTGTDVTKRVDAEEKIETLAYFDPLTSLPNRNKVYDILKVGSGQISDKYSIAAIADLDQFKRINDTLSHSVGDQLIVKLAKRLNKEFSFSDLIARLGADEFLCIEENISDDLKRAKESALVLGERLRNCINKELDIGTHSYTLSASVGVIVFKKHENNADEILQYADTAMYESKRLGRNRVTLFKNEMATQAAQLLQLERDVMKALLRDEFYFVLQPIFCSHTNALTGAEALMRWRTPERIVSPDEFIPFLEESGIIIEVGERVISKIFQYINTLKQTNRLPDGFKTAINISAKQLVKNDFIEWISKLLIKYQVESSDIEIEITESVALNNMQDTVQKIQSLKKMGITFSLDDFGTGYSSLSHLRDLPVDKLKIDRTFINDITIDKQDANLVRSIVQLSENLGLKTVAEGVETQEQVEWLKKTGHIFLQGYFLSKPVEPEEFEKRFLSK